MTKKKKPKNNPIPLTKPDKSKGPLGQSTFIDEILKKVESQPSVDLRKFSFRQPTISLRATGSPSVAYAKFHNKTEGTEQSFQDIENSWPISSQEGNSCNIREGEGEIGETEEPRSPQVVIEQGTPSTLDQGSVVKIVPTPSNHPRNNSLEIPEGY